MNRVLLIVILLFMPLRASAGLIIQVNDNLYEMDTVSGLLSSHRATIENQVWFGLVIVVSLEIFQTNCELS
jgi:hypothetical protein